jgi:hypothetical protein
VRGSEDDPVQALAAEATAAAVRAHRFIQTPVSRAEDNAGEPASRRSYRMIESVAPTRRHARGAAVASV